MMCSLRINTVIVMFAATGVDDFVGESSVPFWRRSHSIMTKLGISTIIASLW